ncbi:hypothetical protein AVEN_171297-1 [Araneus ventricosus]|uniref:Uncharacterized protein n=1 Tax=Araneus ventricosus TaxID=182803 RepID=A0A4Y2KGW7_ARAVE|nr:hypothetical protein AVEN_171297-1 [Araneus ventricosus]
MRNRDSSDSSAHPWSNLDVSEPTVCVVDDDAWSTEAHEWDVCCTVPYPTVSAELCVSKHLRWTCIVFDCQLSHCLAPILFTKRDSLRRPFSWMTRGRPTPWRLLLVSPSFIHFA